jgi:hypothetical protein
MGPNTGWSYKGNALRQTGRSGDEESHRKVRDARTTARRQRGLTGAKQGQQKVREARIHDRYQRPWTPSSNPHSDDEAHIMARVETTGGLRRADETSISASRRADARRLPST